MPVTSEQSAETGRHGKRWPLYLALGLRVRGIE